METITLLILWGISIPLCLKFAKKIGGNKIVAGFAGLVAPIFAPIGYAYVASRQNKKGDLKKSQSIFQTVEENPTYKKIATVLILVVAAIAWSLSLPEDSPQSASTAAHVSAPAVKVLSVGDTGMLSVSDGGDVPVLATKESYEALTKAVLANDQFGQAKIMSSGKFYPVKSGTKILIIDSTVDLRQVRILEGKQQGLSGWTSSEFVTVQ